MGWKTINIQGSSFFSSIRFLEFDPSTACLNCGSIWYHPNPCRDCNGRSFYRIYPLSYYLKKHHWEGLPTEEIPVISDWILRLKEGSTVSEKQRKDIGIILAQISYEGIKTRYLSDFSLYQLIIPAPTLKHINHVDHWGIELAGKLGIPVKFT